MKSDFTSHPSPNKFATETVPSPVMLVGRLFLDVTKTIKGLFELGIIALTTLATHSLNPKYSFWPALRAQVAKSGVRLFIWASILAAGLGAVVVGQMLGVFTDFGAQNYFGTILVSTVINEIGPMAMGILTVSVVGTATVIDLASARTTGALELTSANSRDQIYTIVVPRVIGFGFSILCLSIYFILMTLFFAYLIIFIENIALSPTAYINQVIEALSWESFILLANKSFCFGAIIGIVSCYEALVRPIRLAHLSVATIRTVMESVLLCALVDTLFIVYLLL